MAFTICGTYRPSKAYGYIEALGIPYTRKSRVRIEELCVLEQNRFVSKLEPQWRPYLVRAFDESLWKPAWQFNVWKLFLRVIRPFSDGMLYRFRRALNREHPWECPNCASTSLDVIEKAGTFEGTFHMDRNRCIIDLHGILGNCTVSARVCRECGHSEVFVADEQPFTLKLDGARESEEDTGEKQGCSGHDEELIRIILETPGPWPDKVADKLQELYGITIPDPNSLRSAVPLTLGESLSKSKAEELWTELMSVGAGVSLQVIAATW